MGISRIFSVDIGRVNYACAILSCDSDSITDLIRSYSSRIKNFSGIAKDERTNAIREACNRCTIEWYDVKNISSSNTQGTVHNLYDYFNALSTASRFETIDFVLVESQQVSCIRTASAYNPNMDNILLQQATSSYFYLRYPSLTVIQWSPMCKTSTLQVGENTTYAGRKAATVKFVRERLVDRGNVPLLDSFDRLQKKDDVSDAICQAYSFVIKQFSTPSCKRVLGGPKTPEL